MTTGFGQSILTFITHYPLLAFLGVITGGFVFDNLTLKVLHPILGIRPRVAVSLPTIFTAPLLHKDWTHFITNAAPLSFLGILTRGQLSVMQFLTFIFIAVVGSGTGVWLFGRRGIVIGASGIVFALFGFLPAYAYFTRNLDALLYALIAVVLYTGLFFSLFRRHPQISGAAHVSGFLAGIFAAWYLHQSPGIIHFIHHL